MLKAQEGQTLLSYSGSAETLAQPGTVAGGFPPPYTFRLAQNTSGTWAWRGGECHLLLLLPLSWQFSVGLPCLCPEAQVERGRGNERGGERLLSKEGMGMGRRCWGLENKFPAAAFMVWSRLCGELELLSYVMERRCECTITSPLELPLCRVMTNVHIGR